ncbi:hypothetical protein [Streptomyces sp. NPDC057554]|uniref:hypothetical protein n=1 Tax=unclassified Streptomyces TaxID=2593676 RepID=UPI003697E73A
MAYTPPVLSLNPVEGQTSREFLRAFASRVEKLAPESAEGAYRYAKTWGWWLNTAGDVPGGVANAAVPTVTESWVGEDRSGRERSAYGEPLYPDPEQERDAQEAGLVAGTGVEDRTYGPGEFPIPDDDWASIAPFSADPGELMRQLKRVNWESGMLIHGVHDMIGNAAAMGPADPRLRAAALRVLAEHGDGVKVATTTTWQGQEAIVVSEEETYEGSVQRESVLFDPASGYPMGTESALFGHARRLDVPVPATLSVTEILQRGQVDSTNARP